MTDTPSIEVTLVRCPRCRRHLDIALIQTGEHVACPLCHREFQAIRFEPPARIAVLPQMIAGSIDAGQPCATHSRNAAVTSCQRCGSFICALCRIDVDGQVLCPGCFERLSSDGSLQSTRTTFRDYPGLAGTSATVGCLLLFLSIVLGPLAIYYALKGFKQKKAMGEEDGKGSLRVALVLGVVQTVAGIAVVVALLAGMGE